MSDLISRSKLLKEIETWGGCVEALHEYIEKMPTAYDIDKVVEELNTMSQLITIKDMFKVHENVKMVATDIAIEIVKHGVVGKDVE